MAAANTSNSGDTLSIADFFARATALEPLLAGLASATAVHIYPATDPLQQLGEDDYYPLDPSRS